MINLLPYEYKSEIRAARTNVILVRYISILLLAAVVLGSLVFGSYLALNGTKANAEAKAADNARRLSAYQETKAKADAFRGDLATAKAIMDSNISFSKLVYEIASTVPSGVVLDDLTLSPDTFGSSVSINASAKSFNDATKLRDAFTANNQVFSSVQLQTIRTSDTNKVADDTYPVKVVLSVVINKGAAQ